MEAAREAVASPPIERVFDGGHITHPSRRLPLGVGVALEEDDVIDGFGDQGSRGSGHLLLEELLDAKERRERVVGMNRRHSTAMARVPCFQELERGQSIAKLSHDDAVRAKAQGDKERLLVLKVALAVHVQWDEVSGLTLELGRVLDRQDAVVALCKTREQGVAKGRLSRARASGDEDVSPVIDGVCKQGRLLGGETLGLEPGGERDEFS